MEKTFATHRRLSTLALVALLTIPSCGCFLRATTYVQTVTSISDNVDLIITTVFSNSTLTVCEDLSATFPPADQLHVRRRRPGDCRHAISAA